MVVSILRAPKSLRGLLEPRSSELTTKTPQSKADDAVLVFVQSCREIAERAPNMCRKVEGDAILWFAYPKKSSKRYQSDIGRDDSWSALGDAGFEGVRQIAIDEDWSALRFRRVEQIKSLSRAEQRAVSAEGKSRARGR